MESPADSEVDPPSASPAVHTIRVRAVGGRAGRALRWMRRNAYLALIAAAVLVLTRAVDFAPPPEVRVGKPNVGQLAGDAPAQEFSHELSRPQSVQVRATLRLYPDEEMVVALPDPDMDAQGKLLSQPVVTTILGMNATVEQTVRLEDGELELDLTINATPRLAHEPKNGKPAPPVVLETEVVVRSRRTAWWRSTPTQRIHLDSRGFLTKVEEHGHRIVFAADGHLFSLDLELHRAFGTLPTLAGQK